REFERRAIEALSGTATRERIPVQLVSLVRRDFIRSSPSGLVGGEAYSFRHILIRDAAYASLPKRLRAELHEGFAVWLEQSAGERIAEYEEIVGYHLEQAYAYRAELGPISDRDVELARRAVRRLHAAGRRALGRNDLTAAIAILERAAGLLPAHDP